jgi:hypothetical protein
MDRIYINLNSEDIKTGEDPLEDTSLHSQPAAKSEVLGEDVAPAPNIPSGTRFSVRLRGDKSKLQTLLAVLKDDNAEVTESAEESQPNTPNLAAEPEPQNIREAMKGPYSEE